MKNCPLPNPSKEQVERAKYLINIRNEFLKLQQKGLHGKTRLMRKRNNSRANKYFERHEKDLVTFGLLRCLVR